MRSAAAEKKYLLISWFFTPFFAIANPFAFFTSYYFCFDKTEDPAVFMPNAGKYFAFALTLYLGLTLAKYPIYLIKRSFVHKSQDMILFYLFHSLAQIPYLFLLPLYYYTYWGPRDYADFGFRYFLKFFGFALIAWVFACLIFNVFAFLFPKNGRQVGR